MIITLHRCQGFELLLLKENCKKSEKGFIRIVKKHFELLVSKLQM